MDLHAIISQVNSLVGSIPSGTWDILLQSAIGAVTVSPIALGIKKWFSIDSDKKMVLIVTIGSFLAAASAYLLTVPKFAPWIILLQGWITYGVSQPVYYIVVKPFFKRLGAFLVEKVTAVTLLNEARAAAVPSTGLPTATPSYSDFK
jgi:hypothetical protein